MHILVIPSWYSVSRDEPKATMFREHAIGLAKLGNRVGIISPTIYSLRNFKEFFTRQIKNDVEVDCDVKTYRYTILNWVPRIEYFYRNLWISAGLKMYDKYQRDNGHPNVIHAHSSLYAGVLASRIKQKYGVPYLLNEHSSIFYTKALTKTQQSLVLECIKNAAANVVASPFFAGHMSQILGLKENIWTVIPNPVSQDFIEYPNDKSKPDSIFTFISIALFTKNKNVDKIIKAFNEAFKNNDRVMLKIVGYGSQEAELRRLIKKLDIGKKIVMLGKQTRRMVMESLANSDVLVLASEFETFGGVIVESFAMGRPVIVTNTAAGRCNLTNPGDGLLIDIIDCEKNLVNAMKKIYESYGEYKSEDIRGRAILKFSEPVILSKFLEIYRSFD